MKARRFAPLLALLLLAGCRQPAAETPSPSLSPDPAPSSTTQVTVHWDALEPREPIAALGSRLSDGPLPELIPSDDYGAIVPYIGGEQGNADYMRYYYGLCTTGGLILTDPVYRNILQYQWYDIYDGSCQHLPIWMLIQDALDENGELHSICSLAGADGSWRIDLYNGYAQPTPAGLLVMLEEHTAAMIDAGGRELFRWTPDDLPEFFDNDNLYGSNGYMQCCRGLICYYPQNSTQGIWIDPYTGEFVDDPFQDSSDSIVLTSMITFPGGRYEYGADPLVIYYDDGTTETIVLPDDLGRLTGVSRQNLIFHQYDFSEENYTFTYTLTDHTGKILFSTSTDQSLQFIEDYQDGRSYPCRIRYDYDYPWPIQYEDETGQLFTSLYELLDETGQSLISAPRISTPVGGLLPMVDSTYYRLVDLNNNCENLIRIPRWAALDLPADD